MLLSTAYFPPSGWFALAARDMTLSPDRVLPSVVQLEACENYRKQSYRNRCYILAPGGPQMLQVPVLHDGAALITSVLVDYSTPWVLRTQRSLDTAYRTAAFYEYYRDHVFALLDAQPATLWELNLSLLEWCLEQCRIACSLVPTEDFLPPASGGTEDDFRYVIDPKKPDGILADMGLSRPYYQVFQGKLGGFTPGLSILDLLFNEGPDAIRYLKVL